MSNDVERLAHEVERLGDVVLIQIDPVSAYLGGTDSHKNADVRALLSPLSDLAEKFNVAVVVVTHLNKGSGAAMYRSVGSIAFTAAARERDGYTAHELPALVKLLRTKKTEGADNEIFTTADGTPAS